MIMRSLNISRVLLIISTLILRLDLWNILKKYGITLKVGLIMKYSISVIDKSTGEILRSFEMVRSMPANECERCIKLNLSFFLPLMFKDKNYCLSIDPIEIPKKDINLSELPLIF